MHLPKTRPGALQAWRNADHRNRATANHKAAATARKTIAGQRQGYPKAFDLRAAIEFPDAAACVLADAGVPASEMLTGIVFDM
ncbi:hypothetical protein [Cupriavidus sp. BIC8F]|uniref:hypothetical protein n=1 Tax=Cupriavidus sp. BIC8F TaxID=3079014 RepID=UPI002916528A|nr:hypothetical protein [Cupriavidus sp. BIC8F]